MVVNIKSFDFSFFIFPSTNLNLVTLFNFGRLVFICFIKDISNFHTDIYVSDLCDIGFLPSNTSASSFTLLYREGPKQTRPILTRLNRLICSTINSSISKTMSHKSLGEPRTGSVTFCLNCRPTTANQTALDEP